MRESPEVSSSSWQLLPPLPSYPHWPTLSPSRLIFWHIWMSYSLSPGGGGGCPAGVLHHGLPPLRPLHPSHAGRPPRHLLHPLRACLPNVQPLLRPTGLWTHSWPCLPNPPNSHLSGPSVLYNAQPGWPNGKEQGGTRSKSCSNKKCQ